MTVPTTTPRASIPARGSRLARIAALGGIAAAAALAAVLMFGSQGGYGVAATFANAGQLVVGNPVQVGGTPVGSVTAIELTDDGQARIEMEIDGDVVPLHEGTTAVIRATSLSGIANRYVSLDPGPNDAARIEDGGEIGVDRTTAPVDLDQLFDTLDPETRAGLQDLVQGFAAQYDGRGEDANESLAYLNPALSTSSRLTQELVRDQRVFEDFLVDTSRVVSAVAERRNDLAGLVQSAGATADAIGDENAALSRALATLPGTLRKSNTTFVNLRTTLDDLDVLVEESRPATRDLDRFLERLRPLVADAEPTIEDLRFLIRRRGANNDLVELTSKMPRLADLAQTTFPRAIQTMRRSQPVVDYVRPYTPDAAAWLTKFGQGANAYDANGHYARIQPIFNAFSFADNPLGGALTAATPAQRFDGFETRVGRRCPGGAVAPPPDGSAPYRGEDGDLDCDPTASAPAP